MVGRNDGQEASISVGRAAIDRLSRWLMLVAVGIAGLNVLIGFVKFFAGRDSVPAWLDFFESSDELNFPTWFSTLVLALAGVAAVAAYRRMKSPALRKGMALLSLVMFYMSLDEAARLHERFNGLMRGLRDFDGPLNSPWVIPGAALVLLVGVLFVPFLRQLPNPISRAYIVAGGAFVAAAVGLEIFAAGALSSQGPGVVSDGSTIIEEMAEMLSVILVARVNFLIALHGPGQVTSTMIYRPLWRRRPVSQVTT